MFCPKCRIEYRPGFSVCSDCNVDLVAELPPEPERHSSPDAHANADALGDLLVTVWETFDPAALAVAKSLLNGAGMPYWVAGENFMRLTQYSSPLIGYSPVFGGYRVQVASSDAADAVALLRDVSERLFFDRLIARYFPPDR